MPIFMLVVILNFMRVGRVLVQYTHQTYRPVVNLAFCPQAGGGGHGSMPPLLPRLKIPLV